MKELNELTLAAIISLYHKKMMAEKNNDQATLGTLKNQYPSLFSFEFDKFIDELKASIEYVRFTRDEDFRNMLEPEDVIIH